MLTFNLPVVNRNCFLISIIVWCMGYYLLAWIMFVMVAAVEYDEVRSLYATYEEYYADRMEQERGKPTQDLSADAQILEEQIRLYTQENAEVAHMVGDIAGNIELSGENSYNYHETENADLENDSSAPRTQYTELEAYWTEMIYKDWYHPTGIVMPEAMHYDIHSVCMYHSYYTYKKWESELALLSTSITLTAKVMGCDTNEVASAPAKLLAGVNVKHNPHTAHLRTYALGHTHEVGYKREGVPHITQGCKLKYEWV